MPDLQQPPPTSISPVSLFMLPLVLQAQRQLHLLALLLSPLRSARQACALRLEACLVCGALVLWMSTLLLYGLSGLKGGGGRGE